MLSVASIQSCLVSSLQAQKSLGVYCCPAYTLTIDDETVKVNASFGGDHPTAVYTEGDFRDYRVDLINPPPVKGRTMTCTAEVKSKFQGK